MIEGRVRRDNPRNSILLAGLHELFQFIRRKSWRNFHQHLSFREAKDPRFGVSSLGFGGDRADLDEAKAERCPCRNGNAVFIQPRCKPYWIWKPYSKKDFRFWLRLENFERAQRKINI